MYTYTCIYKYIFSFGESFEHKLETLYSLTRKYLYVYLLGTWAISYLAIVHLSKLGNLTLIQYYYLVQNLYLNCLFP